MLAKHIGVYVLLVDVVVFAESGPESGGVQDRTGADDLLLRQTGPLAEGIGQDVYRVGNDDVGGVRGIPGDLRNDGLGDVHVGLCQIQSRLTGFACDAGGQDHNV